MNNLVSQAGSNRTMESLLEAELSRRAFVRAGLGAAAVGFFSLSHDPTRLPADPPPESALPFGFTGVPISTEDTVRVPAGYRADVLYAWGHPTNGQAPAFRADATNSPDEQALQAGMGHDGMEWFPRPGDAPDRSDRGLLVLNHEFTDQGLLFPDGIDPMTREKVLKSQAAHGVSVIAIERAADGRWKVVDSPWSRRITASTPTQLTGPAAGSPRVKTTFDPQGQTVRGTVNNCASGITPWGTYLTCEENFNGVFGSDLLGFEPSVDQRRYGLTAAGFITRDERKLSLFQWWKHDERFDLARHPNEANRFGYVVEIDPTDPDCVPRKHTALGRFKHENAAVTLTADRRVVVYMADDEKNEYIYKFVSSHTVTENRAANLDLLTEGTLYVARFYPGGRGVWIPLRHNENGLTAENGFAAQADICVRTRQAADRVGATMMDRPEWIAVHPTTNEVFVTLTNNNLRGKLPPSTHAPDGTAGAATAQPPLDAANPRANNVFGHILKWKEDDGDSAATAFAWEHFLLAGDPNIDAQVSIHGDAFGSPDGLKFDRRGILWIQTDVSGATLNKDGYQNLGNNMMLAADPRTRTVRRFLTGPNGCEITGMTMTPDLKTMFVNIQHPGEPANDLSDYQHPMAISAWPDGASGGRPRPATMVIYRQDRQPIGT